MFIFQYTRGVIFEKNSYTSIVFQFSVNLPACILIGFIDFWIINTMYKSLKHKSNTFRIVLDVFLTTLFAVLLSIIINCILSIFTPHEFEVLRISLPLALWNSVIVLLIEIYFYNQREAEAEKRLAIAEKDKIQYQYEQLKAQINPHFLFNSLNVLSSLTYQDAEKANLFAKKMSGVYRYLLLTNERPTVEVKEELSFLQSYLFLEQIRFENMLFVEITKDDSVLNKQIIPVSLQLLVENALKHNITTINHPLTIRIDITSKGITVSNNLQLRTSVDKGGVGLKNLQRQYALHDKVIDITCSTADFAVKLPYIE